MYMYFSMFVVHGTVKMTTNHEDGPCPGELIIVRCSVVGPTLRWIVTDTSLELTSSNLVTFTATTSDVGRLQTIPTSTIVLKFYQNETVENTTHRFNSTISSEMHFHLDVDESVTIRCNDHNQKSEEMKVTPLGTYVCTLYVFFLKSFTCTFIYIYVTLTPCIIGPPGTLYCIKHC